MMTLLSSPLTRSPAIIERSTYIERAWSEHLSDPNTSYGVIPPCKLDALKSEMRYLISAFHTKCFRAGLPLDELTFLSRLKNEYSDKLISKFYMTAKVHKPKLKFRPVNCYLWYNASRHFEVGRLPSPKAHASHTDIY